eukprot:m.87045 g.87045  ORF g.87045 m.87045 type:complete len:95 (+) comp26032_c0_seq2:59-343(+)
MTQPQSRPINYYTIAKLYYLSHYRLSIIIITSINITTIINIIIAINVIIIININTVSSTPTPATQTLPPQPTQLENHYVYISDYVAEDFKATTY